MIRVDLSKCTGCQRCETACSFVHTGRINNHLARIKVLNLYESGLDSPVVCVQCKERYCMHCPENALSLGKHGQVIVSPTLCKSCGVCEKACPMGALEIFNKFVYVCDLCGGKPKCVDACTEGAIVYEPESIEHVSLEKIKKETAKMNPSEKRRFYTQTIGLKRRKRRDGALA
ncbi:MAG: 4Fe-4S dicluster domain-containing protein [Candidatus Aminicenantes bacterium]